MSTNDNIWSLTVEEKISKARVKFYSERPFFSYLLEHMKIYADERVPSMGVNGKNELFYNEKFVEDLSDDVLQGVLAHEVLHNALEHPWRGENRKIMLQDPKGNKVSLWNFAIDIVVNSIVLKNGYKLPAQGILPNIDTDSIEIFGTTVNDIENKSAEEIYDELKQAVKNQIEKNGKGKKDKGEDGYTVEGLEPGFDQHDFDDPEEGSGADKEAKEKARKTWEGKIDEAATYSKQRGVTPLGLGRDYEILNKSHINWRAILRREIAKSTPYDYTWSRPSKKFLSQNIYLPSTIAEEVKVLFAVDLSGSITKTELSIYMAELVAIADMFPQIECRVLTHDSCVADDYLIVSSTKNKLKSLELHGGGGTDMCCIHEYIKTKGYSKSYAILIHLTDGFGSWPEKSVVPSYIVLSENHCPINDLPNWSRGNIPLTN